MASSKATFTLGATTVTVNGPRSGQSAVRQAQWLTGTAADGTVYTYRLSAIDRTRWRLQFADLTAQQKADLENFYTTVAQGPTSLFTYTHTDGTSYTARFVSEPKWQRYGPNHWSAEIELEVDGAVS